MSATRRPKTAAKSLPGAKRGAKSTKDPRPAKPSKNLSGAKLLAKPKRLAHPTSSSIPLPGAITGAQPNATPRSASPSANLPGARRSAKPTTAARLASTSNDLPGARDCSKPKPATRPAKSSKNLPGAKLTAKPKTWSHPASSCADQALRDTQTQPVGAPLSDRQASNDTHRGAAIVQANGDQPVAEAQRPRVAVGLQNVEKQVGNGQWTAEAHPECAVADLLFCAAFLDDTEKLRVATANRLQALAAEGLDASVYAHQLQALIDLEHQGTLALQRAVRKHPLGPWIKRTLGVGEKQGARLIASIGPSVSIKAAQYKDKVMIEPERPRRGPAELWAYCGFRPDQKRRKGVRSSWNVDAKMRAFLIAERCIMQMRSPYRTVYDRARANWADRDVSDLHKHHHALRCVAKAVLCDLFLEAQKLGV